MTAPASPAPELWPSIGDYFVYDAFYPVMTADATRNAAYRHAIAEAVPGRAVIDVGTGADAVLARMCAEHDARRVYAIEALPHAARSAQRTIRDAGWSDVIRVVPGDSAAVELPERADVCVSELIGAIASAEGAAPTLADAKRRHLAADGKIIPHASATHVAAVELPRPLAEAPVFGALASEQAKQIFASVGRPFDVRLCFTRGPREMRISTTVEIERMELGAPVRRRQVRRGRMTVTRDGRVDGLALWPVIELGSRAVDALEDDCPSWRPAYLPAFYPGLELHRGATLEVELEIAYADRLPDYRLHAEVSDRGRSWQFRFESLHIGEGCGRTPFYERLLASSGLLEVAGR